MRHASEGNAVVVRRDSAKATGEKVILFTMLAVRIRPILEMDHAGLAGFVN